MDITLSYKRVLFYSKAILRTLGMVFLLIILGVHGLILTYKWVNPPITNMMLIRYLQSSRQEPLCSLRNSWISLDQISPHIVAATLLSEDSNFFEHKGFCISNMFYALKQNLMKKKTPGTSTITQQTVKNVLLYPKKSYFRKCLELYFACILELIWGKERILEVYLNIIELGLNLYGVENAAQHYFSKSASKLCFDESCLLAAIISNPRYLNPLKPNNFVYYKSSFIFRKGLMSARKQKTDFPCLNGSYGLH